jgi:hypothetical protein
MENKNHIMKTLYSTLICLAGAWLPLAAANSYVVTNLASDLPGVAAQTDPNLVNPWGLAASASSPFWISNNHSGTSTLYDGAGQPFPHGPAGGAGSSRLQRAIHSRAHRRGVQ